MVEQALPPRVSPSGPPPRRSTRKQRASPQPNGTPADPEQPYDRVKENSRARRRNDVEEEEESSSVVYAALNHQLPAGAAAPRPRRREEDYSEYAAIRVS